MPVKDRTDLGPIPTVPDNLDQGPRFGGITETVKDAFVLELRHFFNVNNTRLRTGELLRVDKYAVSLDVATDPLETAVNLIRSYPDITEDMPLIAVLAATGQNLKLAIADNYVHMAIPVARVVGGPGPFVLSDGMTVTISTTPTGHSTEITQSTFKFPAFMFANIASATLDEVISAINFQALYVLAEKVTIGGVQRLGLRAGGPNGKQFPNCVTILSGPAAIPLGFTVNQTNKNYGAGRQAYNRHCISANLTIGLEVVTESENVRTELSDLLFDFFSFVMADRQYQFFGRSVFGDDTVDESYQIIIKDGDISLSGEQEVPRPGDPKDKIYVNRINIPVTAIQYTDRIIVNSSGTVATPVTSITMLESQDLPEPN